MWRLSCVIVCLLGGMLQLPSLNWQPGMATLHTTGMCLLLGVVYPCAHMQHICRQILLSGLTNCTVVHFGSFITSLRALCLLPFKVNLAPRHSSVPLLCMHTIQGGPSIGVLLLLPAFGISGCGMAVSNLMHASWLFMALWDGCLCSCSCSGVRLERVSGPMPDLPFAPCTVRLVPPESLPIVACWGPASAGTLHSLHPYSLFCLHRLQQHGMLWPWARC